MVLQTGRSPNVLAAGAIFNKCLFLTYFAIIASVSTINNFYQYEN